MSDTAGLELLTAKQVCAALQISQMTLFRLIQRGAIRATHVGHNLRIFRESVLAYLEEQSRSYRPKGSRATLGEQNRKRAAR